MSSSSLEMGDEEADGGLQVNGVKRYVRKRRQTGQRAKRAVKYDENPVKRSDHGLNLDTRSSQ